MPRAAVGFAFARVPVLPPPSEDAAAEREADRTAEAAMSTPARPTLFRAPASPSASAPPPLRRRPESNPTDLPPQVRHVLRAPGTPLDRDARAFLEPRLGADFGSVRVHADSAAASSAESLGAQAYAVGTHVVFGAGQYAPGTRAGRTLLAHELAHVVQQQGAARPFIQRKAAPGASAKSPTAGCYVVYDGGVKIGGAACWRFNNPGNVGKYPSATASPAGALNHVDKGGECGAAVGLYVFDNATSGANESGARVDAAKTKARFACEFLEDYSHMGQPYLDAISKRCTFLQGQLPTAAECKVKRTGVNMGNLNPTQIQCIKTAILAEECTYSGGTYSGTNVGDTIACGDTRMPADIAAAACGP